jgi:hypothetical protein
MSGCSFSTFQVVGGVQAACRASVTGLLLSSLLPCCPRSNLLLLITTSTDLVITPSPKSCRLDMCDTLPSLLNTMLEQNQVWSLFGLLLSQLREWLLPKGLTTNES